MRILLDARLYGLENAGLGRYLINLVDSLINNDKKNTYTIILNEKYFNQLKLPQGWKKIQTNCRHYSFSEQYVIPRIINQEKPDLVHFPHFNIPIFYFGKFVVTIHDILMHKRAGFEATTLNPVAYFIKRLGYKFVFNRAVKSSTKIIVPSELVKNDVVKYYKINPDKVAVTYLGVDSKIVNFKVDKNILQKYQIENPYLIYTGNAYPHKNLSRLIQAVALLNQERRQPFDLVVVTSRSIFKSRLEKIVEKENVKSHVKLLGFVPDEDLANLYHHSIAFIYPSLSEGFGLPGLEAMASKSLVLASNIPIFKEIYKDNAIYFNPLDFSSIEKEMGRVIDMDQKQKSERIKKACDFVSNYSWDKMAREVIDTYENCFSLRSGK